MYIHIYMYIFIYASGETAAFNYDGPWLTVLHVCRCVILQWN